jgi:hypothetical protein
MIAVLILMGLVAAGILVGFMAVQSAPVGYQNESGFHYGPGHEPEHAELSTAVSQPHLA